ncbi:4-hydroxybenzoate polyprenyltransferase [Anseongella ginsenosidimutans]|uniref:4-hydroxybenzoate polyprenyltransferase n=1 Tax=Anseongella ginsenosidimutans TaxID=496056 RepID=A0A4R3KTU3_9SPHI|nr:UbiA-like protein EboC [Anseongella ginsenosidimutans]QEC53482.1 polyprenyltransferase [Anseongella ginsenosidimutans]TCS88380.1 4-hydroxybenzoate polyprenyltransferase [Anseongella ginsenosidimutans]
MTFKALFQLLRPANIVTSVADVWAGAAVSYGLLGFFLDKGGWAFPLFLLSCSTACLYGGGVVLNDFFDAALDSKERPERPIPRGDASRLQAGILGFSLLAAGVLLAFLAGPVPGTLAVGIAGLVLLYNIRSKSYALFGPLNMGLCRSFNLLLGISIVPELTWRMSWLGLFPLIFITAVTVISRGEVVGGNKKAIQTSFLLYCLLAAGLIALGAWQHSVLHTLLFAAGWFFMAARPLGKAFRTLEPADIRLSVKAGVLSLIFLNASYAAAFAGWLPALAIAALFPLSLLLARLYAVT